MDRDHNKRLVLLNPLALEAAFHGTMLMKFRFDARRGGESYRPASRTSARPSLSYSRHARSPPRNCSPRLVADTWVPSASRSYTSRWERSRSPPATRHRSRSPSFQWIGSQGRMRSPLGRLPPVRDDRTRSPPQLPGRSGSPRSENRLHEAPWYRSRKQRDASYPGEDSRLPRRDNFVPYTSDRYLRPVSPSRRDVLQHTYSRVQYQHGNNAQGRHSGTTSRRHSPSLPKSAPSTRNSAAGSDSTSRRSSPAPFGFRSWSPANESTLHQRLSSAQDTSPPCQEKKLLTNPGVHAYNERGHGPGMDEQTTPSIKHGFDLDRQATDHLNAEHTTTNIPSQPRSYSIPQRHSHHVNDARGQSPSSSQRHGSNLSLLSAPTGPRGSSLRDGPWAGPGRRPPPSVSPYGPPFNARGGSMQVGSRNDFSQHPGIRQNCTTPGPDTRSYKFASHLAGLSSIVPGGKPIPSPLEIATVKKLSQLDADKERLFEQASESQKLKRLVVIDWDKLDRESSISDLRSELAEGHLQYITNGESIHVGITF